MGTLTCAVCGRGFEPDTDHVKIDAETRRINDRNDHDEYYLHEQCARILFDGWRKP